MTVARTNMPEAPPAGPGGQWGPRPRGVGIDCLGGSAQGGLWRIMTRRLGPDESYGYRVVGTRRAGACSGAGRGHGSADLNCIEFGGRARARCSRRKAGGGRRKAAPSLSPRPSRSRLGGRLSPRTLAHRRRPPARTRTQMRNRRPTRAMSGRRVPVCVAYNSHPPTGTRGIARALHNPRARTLRCGLAAHRTERFTLHLIFQKNSFKMQRTARALHPASRHLALLQFEAEDEGCERPQAAQVCRLQPPPPRQLRSFAFSSPKLRVLFSEASRSLLRRL
jgi:hypothetical protein